tara:strand:- start:336 stop:1340 length:1005 start_codon:yes stop_codon:yes gene_type:complete
MPSIFSVLVNTVFRSTRAGKAIGSALIRSPLIINNPVYNFFLSKRIASETARLEHTPPELNIEVTNHCNSNCVFCPRDKMSRKAGVMDLSLFKKIIGDAVKFGVKKTTLSFMGEPLLDNSFFEKVSFAKENGLDLTVFSNATLIDEAKAEEIVNSGLDYITISLDAQNEKTFHEIRKGSSFADAKAGVKNLLLKRQELGSTKPVVSLNFIVTNANKAEVNEFEREWSEQVDGINFAFPRNFASAIQLNEDSPHLSQNKVKWPCKQLWTGLFITWDGLVVRCCEDFDAKHVLGDVSKQSLADIWNGMSLKELRKQQLELKKIGICENCGRKTVWW